MKCRFDNSPQKIVGALLVSKKTGVVRSLNGTYLGRFDNYNTQSFSNSTFIPRKTKIKPKTQ